MHIKIFYSQMLISSAKVMHLYLHLLGKNIIQINVEKQRSKDCSLRHTYYEIFPKSKTIIVFIFCLGALANRGGFLSRPTEQHIAFIR